jgi:hypothetical protein
VRLLADEKGLSPLLPGARLTKGGNMNGTDCKMWREANEAIEAKDKGSKYLLHLLQFPSQSCGTVCSPAASILISYLLACARKQ